MRYEHLYTMSEIATDFAECRETVRRRADRLGIAPVLVVRHNTGLYTKEQMEKLRPYKGREGFYSVRDICQVTGLTRQAIWRRIEALNLEGVDGRWFTMEQSKRIIKYKGNA
jgi:hypothetical protein